MSRRSRKKQKSSDSEKKVKLLSVCCRHWWKSQCDHRWDTIFEFCNLVKQVRYYLLSCC